MLTRHINFEADIRLPEPPGVVQVRSHMGGGSVRSTSTNASVTTVQVEMFGVSVNSSGSVFYGMQVEAIMDRIRDNLSLDHLSRLLVDGAMRAATYLCAL